MIKYVDIAALVGIALGVGLIFQPWWQGGFRLGFFATAAFTVLHIVTSHVNTADRT